MAATLTQNRDQAMAALVRANDVRFKRARLKERITAGDVDIRKVLLDPPACCEKATVHELLLTVPLVGRVKAAKILSRSQMSPLKTIGSLTERQRLALTRELP